ncbi:AfsR/SARP family transcriptional regulator [Streptomyces clavuligerus]|uniref:Transcriptional activator n=1 Tax=Streptomyces clavuligerus TaxID=1901 RepID=D5SL79_STRCL|nr:BTAD domain-containing putative transcriptional regulator [Streptomyces clavuligerus]ANW22546.1 AfsR family transcriptional regulator [Streptomyces clavuligerus]AXU17433.1 AfsR family transcriptional regulator [Streptomyces clavuligerus]EFG04672.1 Transcriptional activator [Streptomyces clavuligerus]MBY6306880.1 tetratricopeptide repeat protein [Streptomyces clavuligerus]QCS10525.1 AfsR family transcriptional regulator [Streptomyces clavuligerus]
MEFRVLGTVGVITADGEHLPPGPAKRRALLSMLLLRPNRPVTWDLLAETLWDAEPPTHARTVLQGHVSQLRSLLAAHDAHRFGVDLDTVPSGYALRVPEPLVDAHRFTELLLLADDRRTPEDRVRLLRAALALWQGPALAGTVAGPLLEAAREELGQRRLAAVEALASALGELGEHARAAATLRAEAVAHPLRQSLSAALMLALARSGRPRDAADWFNRTRRLLMDEAGVAPGPELLDAHARVLRACAAPDTAAVPVPPAPRTPVTAPLAVPDMLPRRPRGFTGRQPELAALTGATRLVEGDPGPIALIAGGAGVGKTALAVHWAHEHAADFPDGVLFADLCGYSGTPARQTTAVLREFLSALGVPAQRLPDTGAGMGTLYRALTSGRRFLVVLDNAAASERVRPLLPGGGTCTTLVTSRDRLGGLVASDAARPVRVDELPRSDCANLLEALLGPETVRAEPEATERLAVLCDGLPLAVRITAARFLTGRHRSLAALAGQLGDEQRRLSLLDIEDTGIAAALGLTLAQLPEHARRMFRALGTHPGPRFDVYAAAALADCGMGEAGAALERLADAHLLDGSGPSDDAYTAHDLVLLYARSLCRPADPEALGRLLDHYVHTGLVACATAEPSSGPCFTLPTAHRRPVAIRTFEDRQAALAWFEAERAGLYGAVAAGAAAGMHDRVWRLVLVQWPLIVWRAGEGWTALLEQGLAAAELDGNVDAQSRTRSLLGWILQIGGRLTEALTHLRVASELARRSGGGTSEAVARVNLALALDEAGGAAEAREMLTVAIALARGVPDPATAALAHMHLARHLLDRAEYAPALHHAHEGLALGSSPKTPARRLLLRLARGEALTGLGRPIEARAELTAVATEALALGYKQCATLADTALTALDNWHRRPA